MPNQRNNLTHRGLRTLQAAVFMLLLLQGNMGLAQTSSANNATTGSGFSAGEVLVLIAGIVLLILVAWFFGSGQSKADTSHHPGNPHHPHKHYDHPNDPHFRKLKKKTS